MYQNKLRVTKLLLHETGSYNAQFRRPFDTVLTAGTLNTIVERLNGATNYEPSLMGGIANQFISPTATPEKQIDMVNGWGERRMRFMMEIEYNHHMGGVITEVILGYTSYSGVTIAGAVDPRMEFFINSTMQVRNTMTFTPLGNQVHSSVIDSSHILVDNAWTGIYSPVKEQRMRPEDVYSTMSRTQLRGLGGESIADSRAMMTTTAVKSRRSNASAADYMSQILKGHSEASRISDYGAGEGEILDKARGNAAENLVGKDPFLMAISQVRGGSGIGNTFTFNDLTLIDPNVEAVTRAQLQTPVMQATTHHAGQTANWGSSDIFTKVATILSQSVPSLLMDLALTRIVFRSTNRDIGSVTRTAIADAQGFSSGDLSRALDVFVIRLEHEILRDVSYDNAVDFAIEMKVDLLGETRISISLNGEPNIDYVTPSFADALLVPIITADNTRAITLASDFEQLSTALLDNYSQTNNLPMSQKQNVWRPGAI